MSISSGKLIQNRTIESCKNIKNWSPSEKLFEKIVHHLDNEYRIIPDKERIGKGIKFISNHVAKGLFKWVKKELNVNFEFISIN